MRYMVIIYQGQYEDQKMCGLILHLNSEKELTPQQIAENFVDCFKRDLQQCCNTYKTCASEDCSYFKVDFGSKKVKFCSACGKPLVSTNKEPTETEIMRNMDDLFNGHSCSIEQNIIDILNEEGWELWSSKFKSDKIVSIYGIERCVEKDCDYLTSVEDWK